MAGSRQLGINYTQIAMLRLDVFFLTPIDIYTKHQHVTDYNNDYAVVPGFSLYPVNDRMMYGSARAVRVWATRRFTDIEDFVRTYPDKGVGIHSETFLNYTIFPLIRDLGINIVTDPSVCFLRARTDGTVWIEDCVKPGRQRRQVIQALQSITGITCHPERQDYSNVETLDCSAHANYKLLIQTMQLTDAVHVV